MLYSHEAPISQPASVTHSRINGSDAPYDPYCWSFLYYSSNWGKFLTKVWKWVNNGKGGEAELQKNLTGHASPSFAQQFRACNIAELYSLLVHLERNPRYLAIRDHPISLAGMGEMTMRNSGTYLEVRRFFHMLDLDRIQLPDGLDIITNPAGCAAYARELLERYAPELRGVKMIIQLSSSAGINPASRTFSAHFWFFTDIPLTSTEINRWAEYINFAYCADKLKVALTLEGDDRKDALANVGTERKALLDCSMYDRVHEHYFVAPVFIDMADPIVTRTWILDGPSGAARLTIPDEAEHAGRVGAARADRKAAKNARKGVTIVPGVACAVAARLAGGDNIGDGLGFGGFHDPILAATLMHAAADLTGAGDAVFVANLSAEILAAPHKATRSADEVENYASAPEIQRLIDGGRKWLVANEAQRECTDGAVRTLVRNAVGVASELPLTPLGDAHRILEGEAERDMARIVAGREVVSRLVRITVGAGKTYAYLRAACRSTSALVSIDVFAPTSVLQAEMAAKYFPDALNLHGRAYEANDPEKRLCIRATLTKAVYEAGSPFRGTICTGCPLAPREDEPARCGYLQQFVKIEHWPTVIATHGHLLGLMRLTGAPVKWLDDRAVSAVIVDEVVDPFGDDVEFKVADYSPGRLHAMLFTGINDDRPINERGLRGRIVPGKQSERAKAASQALADMPLSDPRRPELSRLEGIALEAERAATPVKVRNPIIKKHATAEEISQAIAVATYVINGGWLPARDGSYWTPPSELKHTDYLRALWTFEKARLMDVRGGDSDEKIKRTLDSPRGALRQNMQRLLAHILDGHVPQTRTWGVDGVFEVTMMKRPLIDPATPLIVLDATSPVVLTEAIYSRKFEVTDLRVKQHIEVRRITGLTGSKASLTGRADTRVEYSDASAEDRKKDDDHMEFLLSAYVRFAQGRSLLVVGQKEITDALKEHAGERYPHIVFKHFNSLRGVDDFKDYWGIAVTGYQQLELDRAERQRACFKDVPGQTTMSDWIAENEGHNLHPDGYFRNPDTGASFHPDPLTEALRWNANEGEILQIIGRLRGVRLNRERAPVQLLVIGDMFVPGLPDPVQTWDWATVLRHGFGGTSLQQHDERMFGAYLGVSMRGRKHVVAFSPDLFSTEASVKRALEHEGGIPANYLALEYRKKSSNSKFSVVVSRRRYEEPWWGENFAVGHFTYALRLAFGEDVEVRHIQK